MAKTEMTDKGFPAVLPLIWLIITASLFLTILPLFVGGFIDTLGYSEQLAGRISGIQFGAMLVAIMLAVLTINRWNLKRASLWGVPLAFLSDFCAAYLQSEALMILTRILSGFSTGVILSTASAGIARLKNPTRVFGIVQALVSLSGFGWFLYIPYLLKTTGMNGPFVGLAAFSLIGLMLVLIWFPRFDGKRDVAASRQGLFNLLTVPLLTVVSAYLILMICALGIWAYWERIGVHCGLSAEGIGTTFALGAIFGMFGGFLAAWISGKIGNTTALITGNLFILASVAMVLFRNTAVYIVSTLIFYMSWFLVMSFFLGLFAEVDSSGRLIAVANIFTFAGGTVGPFLASMLLISPSYTPLIFACCMGLVAVLLLIVIAALEKRPGARRN